MERNEMKVADSALGELLTRVHELVSIGLDRIDAINTALRDGNDARVENCEPSEFKTSKDVGIITEASIITAKAEELVKKLENIKGIL